MKAFLIVMLICIFLLWLGYVAFGEEVPYWKVLLAEAASEGEMGMKAVACVIRNRGSLRGIYGAQRKDLDAFCQRQGPQWIRAAKRIAKEVFEENAPDITGGATHWENEKRFGTPKWAKDMVVTCKIKRHTFYKEVLNEKR